MATRAEIIKRCGLVGAGSAICLYAFFGLLQGAAIGGAAGIGLANYLFGSGTLALMANELLPRVVIAAAMLAGVVVSCAAFLMAGGVAGAACGLAISLVTGTADDGYMVPEAVAEKTDKV